jgi:aminoglycoside phosphotransferase (APT) family kinase protein
MTDAPLTPDALRALLAHASSQPVTVHRAQRLAGGASMETWSVDADVGGYPERLVVRRDMGANMYPDALSRRDEFAVLQRAFERGVRVPRPRWCVDAADAVGGRAFFVMDRVDGESVGRRVVKLPELAEARATMAREMGRQLARIHALPCNDLPFLSRPDAHEGACEKAERGMRSLMDELSRHHPVWEHTLRWLSTHRPPAAAQGPVTLVHGDFRVGNLLVAPSGLAAVIDWEFAHVGDIHEDLAWPQMRDWRFEQDHLRVGGVGTPDELLAGYAEAGGARVDGLSLAWWELMGNLRWSVTCHSQAQRHLSGRDPSVELASLGRKSSEVEWEMLTLLGAAPPPSPDLGAIGGDAPVTIPSFRPTALELLEAARDHLKTKVAPALTDAPLRYQTLVAAHVLGVVTRELSAGPAAFAGVLAGVRALPGAPADDEALCAQIRRGDHDADPSALRDHLAYRTGLALLAWNPLHLTRTARAG